MNKLIVKHVSNAQSSSGNSSSLPKQSECKKNFPRGLADPGSERGYHLKNDKTYASNKPHYTKNADLFKGKSNEIVK